MELYVVAGIIIAIFLFIFITRDKDGTYVRTPVEMSEPTKEDGTEEETEEQEIPELTEEIDIPKADYSKMKKAELLAEAKKQGADVNSRMKKADILAKLK